MDVSSLIAQIHRRLLVALSEELNVPLQGLAQAARRLQGRLSSASRRRLRELDAASGIIRHITVQRNDHFYHSVMTELADSYVPTTHALVSDDDAWGSYRASLDLPVPSCAGAPPVTTDPVPELVDIFSTADDSSDASLMVSDAAVSTEVHVANSVCSGDPVTLIDAAINNVYASLAQSVRDRMLLGGDLFFAVDGGTVVGSSLVALLLAVFLFLVTVNIVDDGLVPGYFDETALNDALGRCVRARRLVDSALIIHEPSGMQQDAIDFAIVLSHASHSPLRWLFARCPSSSLLIYWLSQAECRVDELRNVDPGLLQMVPSFLDVPIAAIIPALLITEGFSCMASCYVIRQTTDRRQCMLCCFLACVAVAALDASRPRAP
eukprot:CAMPEP_0117567754 /NCGR_PEP_ID=MMETSP0784-20121206/57771_1 /TAXON_ID=39447 /ORGANISM="" /LENGTH=378 /DNA_ID=CAMNT_0005365637 /DNA_START=114 /DNA_END=1247 /DNA_ORIENTATION=-